MAPSFEQGIESFKGNSELEKEYISGLRADCFSEVEELYDFCGRKNQESPLIGVLKTQEQLSWIQGRGRASSWRYITGKRHDGVYEDIGGYKLCPFCNVLLFAGQDLYRNRDRPRRCGALSRNLV